MNGYIVTPLDNTYRIQYEALSTKLAVGKKIEVVGEYLWVHPVEISEVTKIKKYSRI